MRRHHAHDYHLMRHRGFTLAELLVVILLATLGISLALSRVIDWESSRATQLTYDRVKELQAAMALHYRAHCSSAVPSQPTVASLLLDGWLAPGYSNEHPLGSDLVPSIIWGDPSILQITATITGPGNLDGLVNALDATYRVGTQFFWHTEPYNAVVRHDLMVFNDAGTQSMDYQQLDDVGDCR